MHHIRYNMLKVREYIEVDVFALERSKNIDQTSFNHLKREVTQLIEAQQQCHCTICGINLFNTIFVFDGYSSFCIGCQTRLGEIKRSVYVLASIGCELLQSYEIIKVQEEQQSVFKKQIQREERSQHEMIIQELQEQKDDITEKYMNLSPLPPHITFQPNQEKQVSQQQSRQNQLKALILRQKHNIFSPVKQELYFFNDEVFDLVVGYTHEKAREGNADGLMQLMKGWTFRNSLIEKKLAKLYGLNQQLKEKFELERSIELSEDKLNLGSDESSDSQAIMKLKQKTEELSKLARFYIGDNPESD